MVEPSEQAVYRLPAEAEWEYACRAGSKTPWSWGERPQDAEESAWYHSIANGHAHPVGLKKPNAWGLFDIHGNVSEWCTDWMADDYYRASPVDDPRGPASGTMRVFRGGRWNWPPVFQRSAFRSGYRPNYRDAVTGFRVVCEIRNP